MSKVKLLDGIFKVSQEKGKEYLVYLNPDRLIAPCYEAIGLKPKDKRYGGWEEKEISGHSLGHYISALSLMYVATEDKIIKEKLNYVIDEIEYLQNKEGTGYVSGFKKDCFNNVFNKDFTVSRFELGGSWVPWYSIHKIYAGLLDAYNLTNNKKALNILINLSNWSVKGLSNLTEEEFDMMLYCEHGGMCEVFGELYEITNNKEYLDLAIRFIDKEIVIPLLLEKDELEGKHANTQIPKILGLAKLYDITGEEKYKKACEYFFEIVTKERSYVIGGNSIDEHFGKIGNETLGVTTAETCNTYNMLKLSEYLYKWSHEVKYMDYYEKALYNHILASQDPVSGMKTYFVSTKPGHFKVYCSKDNSFWCCTGTGMENPAKYIRNIYYEERDSLYINLFIASSLETDGLKLKQVTDFPREEKTNIIIEECNKKEFEIKMRIPYWLNEKDIIVQLKNKNLLNYKVENNYIIIKRKFEKGDEIEVNLSMNLHVYNSREDESKIAFMYGPLVLAGAFGRENFPESDILEDHLRLNHYKGIKVPTIISDNVLENIHKINNEELEFEINYSDNIEDKIKLIPFYNIHHERYTIYFSKMTIEDYKNKEKIYNDDELDDAIIDKLKFNEQQMEIEHKVVSKNSSSNYSLEYGCGYREIEKGGYIEFELNKSGEDNLYLNLSFVGNEKSFLIYIEDKIIREEKIKEKYNSDILEGFYYISNKILKNKDKIKVTIKATSYEKIIKIFSVRLINKII